MTGDPVRIPADVNRPDRLLAGLTARQLSVLAVITAVLYAGWALTRGWLPWPVALGGGALVWTAVFTALTVHTGGAGLDTWALRAARYTTRARRTGPLLPAGRGGRAGRFHHPVRAVHPDGVVQLAAGRRVRLTAAHTPGLTLRAPSEQQGITAALGAWLDSQSGPVQILITSRPVDLSVMTARLRATAGALPHPQLETAALAHARDLEQLTETGTLFVRQILLITPADPTNPAHPANPGDPADPANPGGPASPAAPADQGGPGGVAGLAGLAAAGITAVPLDRAGVLAALAAAAGQRPPAAGGQLANPELTITAAPGDLAGT